MPSDRWRYIPLSLAIQQLNLFIATLHIIPLVAFCGSKSKVRDMTVAEVNEVSLLFRMPDGETLYLFDCAGY